MRDGAALESSGGVHVVFDGSFDGFLCVIYAHYYDSVMPVQISRAEYVQEDLFSEVLHITTDEGKAARVANGIRTKIGLQAYKNAAQAFACPQLLLMDLFSYILLGFQVRAEVDRHMHLDFVRRVIELSGKTGMEAHRYLGFVRFRETTSGVLYSEITPQSYILPQLAEHFKNRMPDERFVIHDINRGLCVIYDKSRYVICETEKNAFIDLSITDEIYQKLWKLFYKTIAVEGRVSKKRFNHILPKRFRQQLTEMRPELEQEPKKPAIAQTPIQLTAVQDTEETK